MVTKHISTRRTCALFLIASLTLATLFSAFAAPAANAGITPMNAPPQAVARQCTHPQVGFPTCYALRGDGTWLREELADTGTVRVTVGTVTFDEMQAAVGEVTATAPSGSNIAQGTLMENEKTPEVNTAELQQILATKSAFVFDARPFNEFAVSHIPGALNVAAKPGVPPSQYVSDVAEIGRIVPGKDAPIVLYCNGPYCGKSKRLAEDLLQAGYTNVRRYQLGIPTWRALVGLTQIELHGMRYVMELDKTAVFFDARAPEEFTVGSLPGARNLLVADVVKAKDDGRLPMEDHNTRIIVFGKDGEQARAVAEAIAKNAFHNVAFYAGSFETLK